MPLSARSLKALEGVHPRLVDVVRRAAELCDELSEDGFVVIESLRTLERQKQLLAKKATRTLDSYHLTGHAVDLVPLVGTEIRWDWPLYYHLAPIIKSAAATEGVAIQWGGDWQHFQDGPHWQIDRKAYPMPPKAVDPHPV